MNTPCREFEIRVNDRIRLTDIRESDKPAFCRWLTDKDVYDRTLRIPRPYTEQDAEKFLAHARDATQERGYPVNFAIRDETGELIGDCGFSELVEKHSAAIGYWLAKPYWGQEIMTDVVRSACDFACVQWKLVRIVAYVFESNVASARVLEKNGFEFEGLLRKHREKNGQYIDAKLYALVK